MPQEKKNNAAGVQNKYTKVAQPKKKFQPLHFTL